MKKVQSIKSQYGQITKTTSIGDKVHSCWFRSKHVLIGSLVNESAFPNGSLNLSQIDSLQIEGGQQSNSKEIFRWLQMREANGGLKSEWIEFAHVLRI